MYPTSSHTQKYYLPDKYPFVPSKKAQALLDKKKLEIQMQELEKQIEMQVLDAFHSLEAGRLAVQAADEKEKTVKKSFDIVSKKYKYGVAAFSS